ncbi:Nucleoside-diphosphate-sugar epimerase [Marinospirillum celere]|uniref:Nucleoside-diphosphate-sugar epimerase n=1 Tax=Marinospirillum celere TaxID=1122252 RepID=A0A1I1E9K4_9GAMM|nr:NAD-dependent epimerase/dehydratase family protein [Marinospirillum celere]SFB83815.1 Nucleoside-diphosphate-sugar epimerase [Marinospirillum celere]
MLALVGGSGFIGTRLALRLAAGEQAFSIQDKVLGTAYPELTCPVDVRDIGALRSALRGAECIVNLAAEHLDNVQPTSLYYDVNVGGAENLCAVAEELGIQRIVFTSSVAVYGFAPANTDESGEINPFHDYGKSKWQAEEVFRQWQVKDAANRSLVIVRPTVVFGEGNRGNVYNLLKQIASGRFVMLGEGTNVKSMAYVENVAAFLEFSLGFGPGIHTYNYVDKPDMDMNTLVSQVRATLGRGQGVGVRLPYSLGLLAGYGFDVLARLSGRKLPVSSLRVKKFCSTTQFASSVELTGFQAPVGLKDGLERTLRKL